MNVTNGTPQPPDPLAPGGEGEPAGAPPCDPEVLFLEDWRDVLRRIRRLERAVRGLCARVRRLEQELADSAQGAAGAPPAPVGAGLWLERFAGAWPEVAGLRAAGDTLEACAPARDGAVWRRVTEVGGPSKARVPSWDANGGDRRRLDPDLTAGAAGLLLLVVCQETPARLRAVAGLAGEGERQAEIAIPPRLFADQVMPVRLRWSGRLEQVQLEGAAVVAAARLSGSSRTGANP